MDKAFWKDIYIYEKYKPVLICPSCNIGLLTLNKDNVRYFETAESISSQDDPAFEHYWTQFRFSAILIWFVIKSCAVPSKRATFALFAESGQAARKGVVGRGW